MHPKHYTLKFTIEMNFSDTVSTKTHYKLHTYRLVFIAELLYWVAFKSSAVPNTFVTQTIILDYL